MSQQPHWHHRHGDRYSQNVTTATGQIPQQQPQPSPGQAKMSDPTRFQGNSVLSQQYPYHSYSQGPAADTVVTNQGVYGHGCDSEGQSFAETQEQSSWGHSWSNLWDWSVDEQQESAEGTETNKWNQQQQRQYVGGYQNTLNPRAQGKEGLMNHPGRLNSQGFQIKPFLTSLLAAAVGHWDQNFGWGPSGGDVKVPFTQQPTSTFQRSESQPSSPAQSGTGPSWKLQNVELNWQLGLPQSGWQKFNQIAPDQLPDYRGGIRPQDQMTSNVQNTPSLSPAQSGYDDRTMSPSYSNEDFHNDEQNISCNVQRQGEEAMSEVNEMSNQFSDINLNDEETSDLSSSGQQNQTVEKPGVMFNSGSSSFSSLEHQPSLFDVIENLNKSQTSSGDTQNVSDMLDVPPSSVGHSRDSSLSGNVQFIIGSDTNSASNTPHDSRGASQSHTPEIMHIHEAASESIHQEADGYQDTQHLSQLDFSNHQDNHVSSSHVHQAPDGRAAQGDVVHEDSMAVFKGTTINQAIGQQCEDPLKMIPATSVYPHNQTFENMSSLQQDNQQVQQSSFPTYSQSVGQSFHPQQQVIARSSSAPTNQNGTAEQQQSVCDRESLMPHGKQESSYMFNQQTLSFSQQVFRSQSDGSNQNTVTEKPESPRYGAVVSQPFSIHGDQQPGPLFGHHRSPFHQVKRPPSVHSDQSSTSSEQQPQSFSSSNITPSGSQQSPFIHPSSPNKQVYMFPSAQSNQCSLLDYPQSPKANNIPQPFMPQCHQPFCHHKSPIQQVDTSLSDKCSLKQQRSSSIQSDQSGPGEHISRTLQMEPRPNSAQSDENSEIAQYTATANQLNQNTSQISDVEHMNDGFHTEHAQLRRAGDATAHVTSIHVFLPPWTSHDYVSPTALVHSLHQPTVAPCVSNVNTQDGTQLNSLQNVSADQIAIGQLGVQHGHTAADSDPSSENAHFMNICTGPIEPHASVRKPAHPVSEIPPANQMQQQMYSSSVFHQQIQLHQGHRGAINTSPATTLLKNLQSSKSGVGVLAPATLTDVSPEGSHVRTVMKNTAETLTPSCNPVPLGLNSPVKSIHGVKGGSGNVFDTVVKGNSNNPSLSSESQNVVSVGNSELVAPYQVVNNTDLFQTSKQESDSASPSLTDSSRVTSDRKSDMNRQGNNVPTENHKHSDQQPPGQEFRDSVSMSDRQDQDRHYNGYQEKTSSRGPPERSSSRRLPERPLSRGPPERPLSRGPPERPSSRGPPQRPLSRRPERPLSGGPPERPLSRGPAERSLSRGLLERPLSGGPPERPLSRGSAERSLSRGPLERPLSRGPFERQLPRGPPERPSSRGPPERSLSRGPLERPLSRGPFERQLPRGPPERPSSRGPPERSLSRGPLERSSSRRPSERDRYGDSFSVSRYEKDRLRSRQGDNYYDNPRYDRPGSHQEYGCEQYERPRSFQGYRDSQYERPRSRQDCAYEQYKRPQSPQEYEDSQYEKPRSRQGYGYEQYEAQRSSQGYRDCQYERSMSQQGYGNNDQSPRSKQGEPDRPERPGSRQSRQMERSHTYSENLSQSRSDYDSYYGNQASYRSDGRYRARDYDGHYGYGYYDYQRDPYYDSYYGQDPHRQRLLRGYYEEMQYYNQHYDSRHHHDDRYHDYYNRQLTGGYDDVDRHSSHSRSSSRGPSLDGNEETGADNFAREFHGQSSRPSSRTDYEQPGGYPNNQYDQSYGHGYDYSSYDYNNGYSHPYQEAPPERRTPVQFSIPHVRVSFGPGGQLAKVVPNQPVSGQPALVEIHDIETLIPPSPETEELRQFPGPLVKGETHKNDVLAFCHHMMRACRDDVTLTDRESAVLCWKLLELLIKQNGTVVGTDIAELLLDGSSVTSTEECDAQKDITISARASDEEHSHTDSANCVTTSDRTEINKDSLSIEEVTDRFRNLLLYGRKKDALEWAMKNSLWGHALFLASKLDNRTHASVMARFASISMRMNDPLQTLYQLMSSRQPAAVTCISDERWGDWRPHLAMVLSNHSNKAELDRKSIIQLGDTLASRRCLYASHFCYLMAQCTFGIYSKKTSKIVLIGSNHTLPWELFANNRAIQCTEVYEYTQSLGNALFSSPNFQLYKFIYATRLAQCGMLEQALHYCEVIANTVLQNPVQYQPIFFKQLYQLGNRLKYSDPQLQHRGDDQSDPYWLQQLLQVCQRFDDSMLTAQPLSGGETQPLSGGETPVAFGSTAAGSDCCDGVATATEMTTAQYQSTFQGQTTAHLDQTDGQTVDQAQPQQTETTDQSQQMFSTDQYNSQLTGQQNAAYGQDRQQAQTQDQSALYNSAYGAYAGYAQNSSYVNYAQPAQNATNQQPAEGGVTQQLAPEGSTNQHTFPPQQQRLPQQQQYNTDQQQQSSHQQQKVNTNYNISNFQQFAKKFPNSGDLGTSVTSVNSTSTETSGSTEIESAANSRPFDYFASSTQQSKLAPPVSKPAETQPAAQSQPETKLSQDTDRNKDSNDKKPKQNSGFFGGMFNKSWFQGKNDDQNPAITSDPVAGKQMNSEPDKENSKPAPPPPKHNELVGAHGKYADALNPGGMGSSATAPSSLFAAMPSNTPAPQHIFTPIIAGGDSHEPVNQSEDNKIAATEPQTESASQSQQPFQTPQQLPSRQSIQQQSYESNQQQSYQQNHHQTSQLQYHQQNKQQTYQQQTYQQNQQPVSQQNKQKTYQQIQQPTSQHQVTYQQNQPQVHQQNQQQNYQDNQQQSYYHNQHAQQMQGPATYHTQQTVQQQTQANEQKISGEDKSAPPPAMPQMPVMFNPAQFLSQQQITASTASSQPVRGLRYGQRRVYPK